MMRTDHPRDLEQAIVRLGEALSAEKRLEFSLSIFPSGQPGGANGRVRLIGANWARHRSPPHSGTHRTRSQVVPAPLMHPQMRMLGFEDAQDFHRLRIDDHDLITDLEVFIAAPCRLDVDHRLGKWRKVNRVWHGGAGR
jgi:hypothetical protein